MHERFSKRIEEGLLSLGGRIQKSQSPLDRGKLERQIGRLLERNSRAGARYAITISEDDSVKAKLKLHWSTRSEWDHWARLSEGTYILRCNIHHWTEEELWKTYVQLSEAEAAFRVQKSDLCIRPIWHRKQNRIKAHVLICLLAYALWKTLQKWQCRAGLGDSPPRFSLSSLASTRLILFCHWLMVHIDRSGCAVWYGLIASNNCSSSALALPSRSAPQPTAISPNVVATFGVKLLILHKLTPRTVEVRLGSWCHCAGRCDFPAVPIRYRRHRGETR